MPWHFLTFAALVVIVLSHVYWRRKVGRIASAAQERVLQLQNSQQQSIQQLRSQHEAIFDSMAEGLLLLDEAGLVQLANRAFSAMFGNDTDLRGRTILESLRLHELAELLPQLGEQRQFLDHEVKLADPEEKYLQVSAAAMFERGRRIGTVLIFHDVTRVKLLEGARRDFVGNVSHELRTPLSLIKGYVETLLDGARNDPEVCLKFLRTIERNADRLKLLIEDLLNISELESGRVTLNLQNVELRALVGRVCEDLASKAAAKSVTLKAELPSLGARADATRVEQVLTNLIDNAIKYGRAGGQIIIGGRRLEAGEVELLVRDDGPGIPANALERVFERFYRLDKARSREQGGTGLGLAIVKHIVQSHRGQVWVESEPGKGATFFFTLPEAAAEPQQTLL